MDIITLEMNISAEDAFREWEDLPDTAPKQQREAYWKRYQDIKKGIAIPVRYLVPQKPQKKPDVAIVAAPLDRLEMIKQLAEKSRPSKPEKQRQSRPKHNLPSGCRTSVIPPTKRAEIHQRINRQLADMGWGAPGIGIPAPFGAITKLQALTGMCSSDYHHTIRAGSIIYPHVLKKLHETMGIREEWMLTGKGDVMWKQIDAAFYKHQKRSAQNNPPTPKPTPTLADLFRQLSALSAKIAEACGNAKSTDAKRSVR